METWRWFYYNDTWRTANCGHDGALTGCLDTIFRGINGRPLKRVPLSLLLVITIHTIHRDPTFGSSHVSFSSQVCRGRTPFIPHTHYYFRGIQYLLKSYIVLEG